MPARSEISEQDLSLRPGEILDAVERGDAFTVTRNGRGVGELIPLRQRHRFVSRAEFTAMSETAPRIDLDRFRADQVEAVIDTTIDPYER